MTSIDPNFAAQLYASSAKNSIASEVSSNISSSSSSGASFSSFLKDSAEGALETMRASEVMSAKAIQGDADITKVVEAVNAAEITLQTTMALRDRMVSAYQEIMRMPI